MPVYQVNLHAYRETIYVCADNVLRVQDYIEAEYGYDNKKLYDIELITELDHPHLEVTEYGVLEETPDGDRVIRRIIDVKDVINFV